MHSTLSTDVELIHLKNALLFHEIEDDVDKGPIKNLLIERDDAELLTNLLEVSLLDREAWGQYEHHQNLTRLTMSLINEKPFLHKKIDQ